jgi:hypothetical protein
MSFTNGLQQFAAKVPVKQRAVFTSVAAQMHKGIQLGDAISGAPATPKAPKQYPRAGKLREDVTLTFPDDDTAIIYTTSPYAEDVEFNAKGHSFVDGGPHGWGLVAAAFPRYVETTAARIAGASS